MPDTSASTSHWRLLPWLVLAGLLTIPTVLAYRDHAGYEHTAWLVLPGALGVLAFAWGINGLAGSIRWFRVWWLLALGLFLACLVRLLFYAVVAFSGDGFSTEVFLHFGWISFVSAWREYPQLFLSIGLLIALVPLATRQAMKHFRSSDRRLTLSVCLVGGLLTWVGSPAMPELALVKASVAWYFPDHRRVDTTVLSKWRNSPMLSVHVPSKDRIQVETPTRPKNLILLYIESGSISLIQSKQHPGLMPGVSELVEKHSFVDHLHASGHVTIEGLVNSMCGTLFPLDNGNNSLAAGENLAGSLPCLGDILHAAGYNQTYLGGFLKAFSGKGPFLESHGYERVLGYHDLHAMGMRAPEGHLAISDADLLEQSVVELEELRQADEPYNLTILTIGSHFPGFVSPGCTPYGDGSDRFLNAVHCSDELITNWVRRLQERGWLDNNTVLVITGDHNVLPNPGIRQLFSESMISDLRIPMIVIGDAETPTARHGAGYDLAPTLLDIVGVRSNVRFALGRSLLRPNERPDQFLARRGDAIGEQWRDADGSLPCKAHDASYIPGSAVLDACERSELLTIIREQVRAHSAPLPSINCDAPVPAELTVPSDSGKPLRFDVSGHEQNARFADNGSTVTETQAGFFLIRFDANGEFISRTFHLPEAISASAIDAVKAQPGDLILVAWRPGDGDEIDATAIPAQVPAQGGGVIMKMTDEGLQQVLSAGPDKSLSLSVSECHKLTK
ncbi:MAG: LTA synthase family protein [Lysobacteraceae bacterium]